jgi:SAM-dependent methyltransferase
MVEMSEPHASEFRRLIREGAGARDIHGPVPQIGFAERTLASDAYVAREVARVEAHRMSSCALLEALVGHAPRILDVGCSTGGGAVAMALSPILAADVVVGVDPEPISLKAARVRARGHGLEAPRASFRGCRAGSPLPFASDSFDLIVSVSVLEFVPTARERRTLVDEMKRVVRPGGHVFLATPSPWRLRDLHSRRWLGDFVRRDGYPWATPPWQIGRLLADFEPLRVHRWVGERTLERAGLPAGKVPARVAEALARASRWQRILARKPGGWAATCSL